jgi:uncharacterized membrane protein YhaH (DUF805 family)
VPRAWLRSPPLPELPAKLIFDLVGILIPGINALVVLVEIGLIIPTLAVGARRLHERNLSGWWQLLNFVPILGWIALVIMLALPATVTSSGRNRAMGTGGYTRPRPSR